MSEQRITTCPSCDGKLRMKTTVLWTTGYVRCPVCGNRVFVSMDRNVKQDKK
ncbi:MULTISPECIES: hypothetical protein [unclassified Oceanispirochaeta]|uniref:hypothetical protein n=1 Tax=unclassified Oceanispirochaeta TaxID=2635722 RepID=UPI00131407CC|nr:MULTISPECIES: hypothetical protein [unclassified Oceanispirochaeta]MBF9017278.1 hypothetical protein [Oceanispirochaeta sp. M2]NPD73788.1 hypothetical protein [Oceanispirochaeta sp. M1]